MSFLDKFNKKKIEIPDNLKYFAEYFSWLHFCQRNFHSDKNILIENYNFVSWILSELDWVNVKASDLNFSISKENITQKYFEITRKISLPSVLNVEYGKEYKIKKLYPEFYILEEVCNSKKDDNAKLTGTD